MNSLWLELIIIALLILINGFFACAEFAVISIRKGRVAQLAASGDKRAKIVDALQKNPHKLLAVIQIGVTVVGSTASALGGIIAVEHLRPLLRASSISFISNGADLISVVLVVVFLSYFLLILGELVPKTIGLQRSESVALRVAIPLKIISSITGIFVAFLSFSSRLVLRILGIKEMGQAFISREEIQQMVVEGEESGVFTETEKEYIENIFDFTNMVVREVMVPRTRIVAVNLELSREEILKIILENEYSRYPVFH
ncbi:MAG: CNNM domain-containing protein, partial [Desulfuromonadales bacterium]|nr:CNNM domain-containing protein [Desulfuromonadales bacterium]